MAGSEMDGDEPLFFQDSSGEEDSDGDYEPGVDRPADASTTNNGQAKSAMRTPSPAPTKPSLKRSRDSSSRAPTTPNEDDIIDISDSPITMSKLSSRRAQPPPSSGPRAAAGDEDDDIVMVPGDPGSSSNAKAGPSRVQPSSSSSAPPVGSMSTRLASFDKGFIGEYYVTGYSLNKGKGYVTNNAPIHIERNKSQAERDKEKAERLAKSAKQTGSSSGASSRTTVIKNGKIVKTGGAPAGKQMTLGAMGMGGKKSVVPTKKAAQVKPSPADSIIRFRNERGFEVGRIPTKDAEFLSPLLEADLVHLDGYVLECPPVLTTGCDITLCLRVYLKQQAFMDSFTKSSKGKEKEQAGSFWQQQGETEEERKMRARKDALVSLFDRVDLKPIRTSALVKGNKQLKSKKAEVEHLDHATQLSQYVQARSRSRSGSRSGSPKKKAKDQRNPSPTKKKNKAVSLNSDDEVSDDGSGDEGEQLDEEQLNELDIIYQRAQRNDGLLPEMDPPDSFLYSLRPYQKQALHWMNALETGAADVRDQSMHPLWEEYGFKSVRDPSDPIDLADDDEVKGDVFFFNPYDGDLSLDFPKNSNRSKGGILADAMGMGKTCMLASLIHTNREGDTPEEDPETTNGETEDIEPVAKRPKFRQITLSSGWKPVLGKRSSEIKRRPHATLVVAPVSLARQWMEELDRMSVKGTLKAQLWYGTDRPALDLLLDSDPDTRTDVIITSYGTIVSEHAKWIKNKQKAGYQAGGSLFDVEWLRTVLDEAHTIKNRSSKAAKACCALVAQRRWAVTGTPIVNYIQDLFSLLQYLQLDPWGSYSFFRSFVTVPFLAKDPKALDVIQFILETCLLRRDKTHRDGQGRLILDLPEKTVTIQKLEFSLQERKIYDAIFDKSRRAFIKLDQEGKISSAYTSILAMLMKLRQAVDHPLLVMNKTSGKDGVEDALVNDGNDGEEDLQSLIAQFTRGESDGKTSDVNPELAKKVLEQLGRSQEVSECVVCGGETEAEVYLPCYHTGCRDCVQGLVDTAEDKGRQAVCPACQKGPVTLASLKEVVRSKNGFNPAQGSLSLRKVDFQTSTKLKALIERLRQLKEQDPKFKALVFSQFTSMLTLIEPVLTDNDFDYLRFDGSMSQKDRAAVVEAFGKPSTKPKIFLISLKAGGVGLNLTAANHVFMMDCWWNSAVEEQAVDRVHRMGQTKPVFVTRFIVRKTIERRILKIQKRKTAMINASLSKGGDGGGGAIEDMKAIFGLNDDDDISSDEEVDAS